jgi:hypothetical protein
MIISKPTAETTPRRGEGSWESSTGYLGIWPRRDAREGRGNGAGHAPGKCSFYKGECYDLVNIDEMYWGAVLGTAGGEGRVDGSGHGGCFEDPGEPETEGEST